MAIESRPGADLPSHNGNGARRPDKIGRPPVLAVVGTSSVCGMSAARTCIVHGLTRAGLRIAAGTATSTGNGSPVSWDTARAVLDFDVLRVTASYRLDREEASVVFASLIGELADTGADAVVLEIGTNAHHGDATRLFTSPAFSGYVDRVVCTAADPASAVAIVEKLRSQGIHVAGVTGHLTSSRAAFSQARLALDVHVVATHDLCQPEVARLMLPPNGPRTNGADRR